MPDHFRYDSISGGPELTRAEIDALAARGVRSVLNLDEEGEPGQELSPNVEATWAHANAMLHARSAMPAGTLTPEAIQRALHALADLPRPVHVRSRGSRRAAALVTIWIALDRGHDADEAFADAERLGISFEPGPLRDAVRAELTRRRPARAHEIAVV